MFLKKIHSFMSIIILYLNNFIGICQALCCILRYVEFDAEARLCTYSSTATKATRREKVT